MQSFKNIDEYISIFTEDVQELLNQIRNTVKNAAPEAQEKISYGIPTFHQHGNLVHFAAYKNHIGFYPTPSGMTGFDEELSIYKRSKGSVHLPLDKPLPLDLIRKIVELRVKENLDKARTRTNPKAK